MRYAGKQTLYDVLDLPRNASAKDVIDAYRRLSATRDDSAPPLDPRRMALLHEAYEVLADAPRRAAYDASLVGDRVLAGAARGLPMRWIAIGAGAILIAIAAVLTLRPRAPANVASRDEIGAQANVAVARLQAIDVSGRKSAIGLATTVDEGTMATTCHGLAPGAQLVVDNGTLTLAATVAIADAVLDVCKLTVAGGASHPVASMLVLPRVGDAIYVTSPKAAHGVAIDDARVSAIAATSNGKVIEIDKPVAAQADGGAVFDTHGKLLGIATSAGASAGGRGVVLPSAWIAAARSRPATR
jgi:hypothetical protein